MKRLLGRARRSFPLRPGAVVLLLVGFFIVRVVSPEEVDVLLAPAGIVALGLVAIATAVTLVGTLWLRRAVRTLPVTVPARIETQTPVGTGFRFPSLGWALMLDVTLEWVEPPGITVRLELLDGQLSEVITALERGRLQQVVRRFTVQDIFGLARLSFDVPWELSLTIVPLAATRTPELAAGRAQGETLANPAGRAEGDLVEMRQYTHGDPLRHVLWKTYARTRKLLVRMPERALAPGPISVAVFVAGPRDEATAGVARLYVEGGLLGADLVFASDGAPVPARTPAEAVDQLVDSATAKAHGGAGLDATLALVDQARLHACLLFVPAVDGPWRQRTLDVIRKYGLHPTVIIGVDEHQEPKRPGSRFQQWLYVAPAPADGERPQLAALRASLEAEGLPVKVLHRSTGQLA